MSETVTYNEESKEKNITAEVNETRLKALATEINTIKHTTQRLMMQAAIDIGQRLVEVKAAVGHGNWGKWLLENVDYSERTAQNLIRLYEEYGRGQGSLFGEAGNPQLVADLSVSQAVALLGIKDADERAEFIEKNDVAAMTKRELEEAIRERNEAREELAAAREAAENGEEAEKKIAAYRERLTKAEASAAENEEKATAAEEELVALRTELREAKAKAKGGSGSAEDKARIAELEAALKKAGDTSRWEFAAGVKGIQEGFNGLLRLIEGQEEEARAKYQTALKTLLSEMLKLLA
mgnify:FL=1|jgi:hypothetical protein